MKTTNNYFKGLQIKYDHLLPERYWNPPGRAILQCLYCGIAFQRKTSAIKRSKNNRHCCSINCSGNYSKEHPSFDPGGFTVRGGYVRWHWPSHPLSVARNVSENWLVFWQEMNYSLEVLRMLKEGELTIHHRNLDKLDNRSENLEPRFHSHLGGVGLEDAILILSHMGYTILPPD